MPPCFTPFVTFFPPLFHTTTLQASFSHRGAPSPSEICPKTAVIGGNTSLRLAAAAPAFSPAFSLPQPSVRVPHRGGHYAGAHSPLSPAMRLFRARVSWVSGAHCVGTDTPLGTGDIPPAVLRLMRPPPLVCDFVSAVFYVFHIFQHFNVRFTAVSSLCSVCVAARMHPQPLRSSRSCSWRCRRCRRCCHPPGGAGLLPECAGA